PGGLVHEIFPAAGFITSDHTLVGFLTEAGYKNHYTRSTRRRLNGRGHGFVGMRKLPDAALFSIANPSEQEKNIHYIRQTFGELYNLDAGITTLLPLPEIFHQGAVNVKKGIEFVAPLSDQKIFTISLLCK